jgi:hypothetical protein
MTRSIILAAILLAACNSSEKTNKDVNGDTSRSNNSVDTTTVNTPAIPWIGAVTDLLKKHGLTKWHVMTDAETGWTKDVFDYFVTPERKTDPDFPYITKGDYDCDGKSDVAAIVTDSLHKEVRIVYFLNEGNSVSWWKEDVQGAAMKNLPKSEVAGFENLDEKDKKIQMKCDGLDVAWFEKSSYVIYRDGKGFSHIWTSD